MLLMMLMYQVQMMLISQTDNSIKIDLGYSIYANIDIVQSSGTERIVNSCHSEIITEFDSEKYNYN